MFKEFKEFALKGNVLDMAVGIIIGAAFTNVVTSLVKDIMTPPLELLQSNAGKYDGLVIPLGTAQLKVGLFLNNVISFLLTAFAVFLLVRAINRFRRPAPAAPPATRPCPYCDTAISLKAVKCPNCTADLPH